MGDACHPMLPFLAQGAVMAIEDAWVLSRKLQRRKRHRRRTRRLRSRTQAAHDARTTRRPRANGPLSQARLAGATRDLRTDVARRAPRAVLRAHAQRLALRARRRRGRLDPPRAVDQQARRETSSCAARGASAVARTLATLPNSAGFASGLIRCHPSSAVSLGPGGHDLNGLGLRQVHRRTVAKSHADLGCFGHGTPPGLRFGPPSNTNAKAGCPASGNGAHPRNSSCPARVPAGVGKRSHAQTP